MQEQMPSPQSEPLKPVLMRVNDLISNNAAPIPTTLLVKHRPVSIKDIAGAIFSFRMQKRVLESVDSLWPAVRLRLPHQFENSRTEFWAPVDLLDASGEAEHIQSSVFNKQNVSALQATAYFRAERAGLDVELRDASEMTKNFTEMVSDTIEKRSNAASNIQGSPPQDHFTVVTDSPNVEVLYATGYFVSTRRGFGFSTPAVRSLPWGNYIFGSKVNGVIAFEDTLWSVPTDKFTTLRV